MEISALKTVFNIMKTHWEIDEKSLNNKNLRIMFFVKISKRIHNIFKKAFLNSFIFFGAIFQQFFVNFSVSFQYLLTRISALKFPLNETEYYALVCSALKV